MCKCPGFGGEAGNCMHCCLPWQIQVSRFYTEYRTVGTSCFRLKLILQGFLLKGVSSCFLQLYSGIGGKARSVQWDTDGHGQPCRWIVEEQLLSDTNLIFTVILCICVFGPANVHCHVASGPRILSLVPLSPLTSLLSAFFTCGILELAFVGSAWYFTLSYNLHLCWNPPFLHVHGLSFPPEPITHESPLFKDTVWGWQQWGHWSLILLALLSHEDGVCLFSLPFPHYF